MFFIVAHHYVVNSGIVECYEFSNVTLNMVFLQLWGMWGKTAINVFVLISGYFMCTSSLTVRRFLKVYLEAKFYRIVIFFVLLLAGYETFGLKNLFKVVFGYIYGINNGFTSSFLAFYLFIPFYNLLISKMDKKQMQVFLGLLLGMFTMASTFFFNKTVFNYVGWYMTVYFIAAYIRIYGTWWMERKWICGGSLLVLVFASFASVLAVDFSGNRLGFQDYYYMVADSNKLFALLVSVFAFLFFRNLKIGINRMINRIAASCFGVLCIHASSDAMRTFLWGDLFRVKEMYMVSFPVLVFHAVGSALLVYIICTMIDMVRIQVVEKPIWRRMGKFPWFYKMLY